MDTRLLEVTELPLRMRSLARDARGVPVPWFLANSRRWLQGVREQICWVCGQSIGPHQAFVVEPVAIITRKALEPPSHRQCAEWRAQNEPEGWGPPAPWPGVLLVYLAQSFTVHKDGRGELYIHLGEPEQCTWWRNGRAATREEIIDAVEPAFLALEWQADQDWDALSALYKAKAHAERYYPEK